MNSFAYAALASTFSLAATVSHATLTAYWDFEDGLAATSTDMSISPFTTSETFPTGSSIVAGGVTGSNFSYHSTGANGSFINTNVSGTSMGITGSGSKTLVAWVKSDTVGAWNNGDRYGILSYSPDGGSGSGDSLRLLIDENAGGLRFEVSAGFIALSQTNLDDGNWHMLAVVINAGDTVGDVDLYLDGEFLAHDSSGTPTRFINTGTSATPGNIANMAIGATQNTVGGGADAFKGQIDGVRVYDEALSEVALDNIYTTVPEPQTYALVGAIGLAVFVLRRRK
ncbi:LamG-like jellyroll fold domain-containing protein [Cerasicoccus fimbriatus]|uniref:LamG-like jellyroll fold domain-containing protein n=1 Tax=Cerasicoccus fimbriatus TaxID=3014554 RepID=UPI0022B572FC|nr:LamG-like jellyroll fold domain-containing protein [Cerasicoccus sp. TK19100]